MPSFDIVSEVNFQEVDNAVNQAAKEIAQRFDFKGSRSEIKFDKEAQKITIVADDELKLRAIHQVLDAKLAKRNVQPKCLDYKKEQQISGNMLKQEVALKVGLEKEEAKKVQLAIKESKLKITAQTMDKQVRVTGKSIDDLQAIQSYLKAQNFEFALQFTNQRR